ncbi:methyltransferase family protein [Pseudoduganella flava]|uniref:Class I SAM-dependent methyltransferase n=1 Tax=Pseudoduganella flava TaxID=871742 RepID=A0A562PQA1_9BURK|nr:class I SAM-dependent methyltransferase [Pseudoduganella flava]QGZ37806.1 class I SAM-dependent methyltransferase [Pseudoduganella flava]TWI46627.1 methyltransferase family protein [Pseudoduganella flava]
MFPLTSFLFIGAVLLLCAYTLHKVRLIHLMLHDVRDQTHRDNAGLFRQLEALQGLYTDLGLTHSLPDTRGWAASPDFLLELTRHAQAERPRFVVECSSGTSTLVLARCMQINGAGKVYSLEHDPIFARQTRQQLARHGLSDWAVVLDAPLTAQDFGGATWPWYSTTGLPAAGEIDMLVIDGPPQATRALARYPAGPALFGRLAPGAAIFLDDARRPDEQQILRRWADEYPEIEQRPLACEKGAAVLRYRPRA